MSDALPISANASPTNADKRLSAQRESAETQVATPEFSAEFANALTAAAREEVIVDAVSAANLAAEALPSLPPSDLDLPDAAEVMIDADETRGAEPTSAAAVRVETSQVATGTGSVVAPLGPVDASAAPIAPPLFASPASVGRPRATVSENSPPDAVLTPRGTTLSSTVSDRTKLTSDRLSAKDAVDVAGKAGMPAPALTVAPDERPDFRSATVVDTPMPRQGELSGATGSINAGATTPAAGTELAVSAGSPGRPATLGVDARLPLATPRFSAAFAQQITVLVEHGIQHAHVTLDPPDLGPVSVRISFQNDEASVYFASHHGLVRDAVTDALPRLRELLEQSGLRLSDTGVFAQLPQREQAEANRSRPTGDVASASWAPETPAAPEAKSHSLRLIDAYV